MTKTKSVHFFKAPRYLFRKFNIIRILKKENIKTFIDVGYGAGELACTLAKKGYTGYGVDFSQTAMEVANKLKEQLEIDDSSLVFMKGNLNKVKTKSADIIICCEVLEHIENDSAFLKKLHALNASYLLLSVPSRQKWYDEFDKKVGHFRRYEKDDLSQLLQDNGYNIIEFSAYGYPFINFTRLVRRFMAGKVPSQSSDNARTKESGVNPIKTKHNLARYDIEAFLKPLYLISVPFNKFNLSEGYLVLCRKK
jgi:SAM-dependent methyltransferase